MKHPQVIEGTPKEIQGRLQGINGKTRLTLIIPAEGEQEVAPNNLYHATPEERANALDEIAEMNRDLPALTQEALRRENLYEERF